LLTSVYCLFVLGAVLGAAGAVFAAGVLDLGLLWCFLAFGLAGVAVGAAFAIGAEAGFCAGVAAADFAGLACAAGLAAGDVCVGAFLTVFTAGEVAFALLVPTWAKRPIAKNDNAKVNATFFMLLKMRSLSETVVAFFVIQRWGGFSPEPSPGLLKRA